MTRRRRLLIIALAVLAGVPLLAALGVGGYLARGGLERQIEHGWSERGLPGSLSVGAVRLVGLDAAVVERVTLRGDGQEPLVEVDAVQARFDILDKRLISLRFEGVRGTLDRERYAFLQAIITAEASHHATRPPQPVRVEIDRGALSLPGGLQLSEITVRVDALGAQASAEAVATLGGRPLRLSVSTSKATPDAPVVTEVGIREGAAAPADMIAVAVGLGLARPLPSEAAPWLPKLASFAGTEIRRDPVSDTIRGSIVATWEGGRGSCEIDADARRLWLRRLEIEDAALGTMSGTLQARRDGSSVALDAAAWQPGPRLPLPPNLPWAEIRRLLPDLQVRWPAEGGRTSLALVGPGGARIEALLGGGPLRVHAAEVPLTLAQAAMPAGVQLGGGHLVSASAVLVDGRPEVSAQVRQARVIAEGWAFGPLDGLVAAVVASDGTLRLTADLPQQNPVVRVTYAGKGGAGTITAECSAIEALLARLRGPVHLPDLTGAASLEARFAVDAGASVLEIVRLRLDRANLDLAGSSFIRDLSCRLSGTIRLADGVVAVNAGGQLSAGRIRIPGDWLDLAARTPIFTMDCAIQQGSGRVEAIDLRRLMVRAANAEGQPVSGLYSAQVEGRLAGERLAGRLVGIVDHADIGWVTGLIAPGQVQVQGEGAVAFQAEIESGEAKRIDGTFLPLGADISVDGGKLRIDGITGGIRFTIDGKPRP